MCWRLPQLRVQPQCRLSLPPALLCLPALLILFWGPLLFSLWCSVSALCHFHVSRVFNPLKADLGLRPASSQLVWVLNRSRIAAYLWVWGVLQVSGGTVAYPALIKNAHLPLWAIVSRKQWLKKGICRLFEEKEALLIKTYLETTLLNGCHFWMRWLVSKDIPSELHLPVFIPVCSLSFHKGRPCDSL